MNEGLQNAILMGLKLKKEAKILGLSGVEPFKSEVFLHILEKNVARMP